MESLTKISKDDFYSLTIPILFNDEHTSRRFGIVGNKEVQFGLSWQSDLIEPVVTGIGLNIYGVGIDQNFAIFDLALNSILFTLNLTYNFFTIQIFNDSVLVITELEIIRLSMLRFEILKRYPLPDYFDKSVLSGGFLEIKCVGNKSILIE